MIEAARANHYYLYIAGLRCLKTILFLNQEQNTLKMRESYYLLKDRTGSIFKFKI